MATSSVSRSTPRGKARLAGLHLRLSPRQKPGSHCVFTEPVDTWTVMRDPDFPPG